ncbi:hemin uptake protein HemP [Pelagibius marinus]|uniref:hemin uptake protein HemP n=1 Tax=Pelagibius marinus TaxID=2762760 RepID=UPI001872B4CB|nr:hemin uptake protein HemP [Pelagibius marinus]
MNVKSQQVPAGDGRPVKAAPRRLRSRELLADAQEVIIEHDGDDYRLRCTSKGKLILTK